MTQHNMTPIQIQQRLNEHGFGPIATDGIMGPRTNHALLRFQVARGLKADGIVGPMTAQALAAAPLRATPPFNLARIAVLAKTTFELVGVRGPSLVSNMFDDHLCVVDHGIVAATYAITTDPGTFWRENPGRVEGTGILVEYRYENAYVWGLHQNKYETLVQRGAKVAAYRDADKDNYLDLDPNTIQWGFFGANIHKAGVNSTQVDKWSAMCQVFAREADWKDCMGRCKATKQAAFTYTLVKREQVK